MLNSLTKQEIVDKIKVIMQPYGEQLPYGELVLIIKTHDRQVRDVYFKEQTEHIKPGIS